MVRNMFCKNNGFSLMEIVSVLVVIGILAAVAVSRFTNYDAEVHTGVDALKEHLRYAQTMAMHSNPTDIDQTTTTYGIQCASNSYWLFKGTDTADAIFLPEEEKFVSNRKINLTSKKIRVSDFTIYFDNRGIPYSAYTNITANTPLSAPVAVYVQPLTAAAPKIAVTITPLTGYIP